MTGDYHGGTLINMERTVNVKEFKIRATRYVNGKDEVVITNRGKPVAFLTPIESASPEGVILRIGKIFKEARIRKADADAALKAIRQRLYGSRRS